MQLTDKLEPYQPNKAVQGEWREELSMDSNSCAAERPENV